MPLGLGRRRGRRAGAEGAPPSAAAAGGGAGAGAGAGGGLGEGAQKRRRLEAEAEACTTGLTEEEEAAAVAAVARRALAHWGRHRGAPLPRAELTQVVKEFKKSGGLKQGLAAALIAKAAGLLARAAGLELVEVSKTRVLRNTEQERTRLLKGDQANAAKCFFLRTLVSPGLRQEVVDTPEDQLSMAFATVCVAFVSMAGGSMPEETLYQYLGDLGVIRGKAHPVLGDVEEGLKQLLSQRYLMREKKVGPGERGEQSEFWEIHLAEGSLHELGQDRISGFISDVMQGGSRKVGSRDNPEVVPESPENSPAPGAFITLSG